MRDKLYTALLIAAIIVPVLYLLSDGHKVKRTDNVIQSTEISLLRKQLIDSVNTERDKQLLQAIDSAVKANRTKIQSRAKSISKQKQAVSDKVEAYRSDTAAHSAQCDSALSAYSVLTDSLQRQVDECSIVTISLTDKSDILQRQLDSKKSMIDNVNANIERMQKELNRTNNWWRRNEKWLFFIGGSVSAYLILK